ncbi:uncharacterized protein LOC127837413 [Dreissena polymorpha]|uniref:Uncharacterized protein n=1 Tax=Dreissena polymorpha TaxID=45954 RepID=A0A9D4RZQ3_DREPO|nr:uncharacterized protein LOC127837413 [Dreissena polymorpha]XP_052220444.1 uncharacterized protein LOC127837413 [Dreissena polymorpha]XP_052220453.1 uncharacterized protein LOC127837413 [Dreissena polymorpha]KAH3884507.1 hypothetical protein DPMN_008488 [Dreissena polymorpha]
MSSWGDMHSITLDISSMSPKETTRAAIILSNTTTENASSEGSGFNFAVFTIVGVVVVMVGLCLKCCEWFRRYTRGNDKDGMDQYAVIVSDGDDDYLQIDMLSESASSQYDTVSSFNSFQKRNNNNTSNKYQPQYRSSNVENKSRLTDTHRHWLLSRLGFSRESGRLRGDTFNNDSESSFSVSSVRMLNNDTPSRLPSTSSVETETDRFNTSDSSILRHNNKQRVSFIEDKARSPKNWASVHRPSDVLKKVLISKLELNAGVHRPDTCQTDVTAMRHLRGSVIRPKLDMVSIATQTNKAFRYSLIKRNRRHFSESVVEGHFDRTFSSIGVPSDQMVEGVKKELIASACICDNRFYVHESRPFQDEEKLTRSNGYDVCNKTNVFPLEPRVKISNGDYHIDKDINDIEMADDVFITEPLPDGDCSLILARCDGNEKANEHIETCVRTTTTECTAENCVRCNGRHHVDCSKIEVVTKMPKSLSDPVDLKQSCFERLSAEFDTKLSELTKNDENTSLYDIKEIVEECYIKDGHQRADDCIYDTHYRETDARACPCHKHICRHCTNSFSINVASERMRHNSGRSDAISVSLTSLESSGYAGEMSSEQSE